jgi:8-amino-7-oxononanoate synthase
LLQQVGAARAADIYPLYPCVRPPGENSAGNEEDRQIVLVANDYLGLSFDARVKAAAQEAIAEFGSSRCASPLAGGNTHRHVALEEGLKSFFRQEAVAVFASGYQANVGIISAIMQPGDLILTDLFNHASIVDGARLSGAEIKVFQHNRHTHLDSLLKRERQRRRVLVIVEGIYSADGDIARLPEITEVAHAHGALVMIDEAHSLGVLGAGGRGAAEHFDMLHQVDLIMGTMSKSLASVGGFVVGDQNLVDVVRHNGRSLIFSAAPPPASVAAAHRALQIIDSEPERRTRLWDNAHFFLDGLKERGFEIMGSETPVIPLLVGDPLRTMELTVRLRQRGVLVCPAIPPMVQAHRSRVRAHVTAAHDRASLQRALDIIEEVGGALGLRTPERAAAQG